MVIGGTGKCFIVNNKWYDYQVNTASGPITTYFDPNFSIGARRRIHPVGLLIPFLDNLKTPCRLRGTFVLSVAALLAICLTMAFQD